MHGNKFFDTLRTLNRKELSRFKKFLKGNYGNQKIALSVFDYISHFFPGYKNDKKLKIDYAYNKIFGGDIQEDSYNRFKLLNALSDLTGWLKEFLLLEKVRSESIESQLLWFSIATERGLKKESTKQLRNIRQHISTSENVGTVSLLKSMLVNYFQYYHQPDKKSEPQITSLLNCIIDLDNYYVNLRMKLACEIASLQKLQIMPIDPGIPLVITQILEWQHLEKQSLFSIYKDIYILISDEKENEFYKVEEWLRNNHLSIEKEDLHIILSYLHNFAANQVKNNNTKYVPVIHRLNRFGAEHDFFIQEGAMSPTQFNNIINIACNQGDFEWAHHFINTHAGSLQENQRSDTINLSEAVILFNQKEFEASYNILRAIDFASLDHAIYSKLYIIRCLFELDLGGNLFENTIETLNKFLQRKRKVRLKIVEPSLNFIRLIRIIYEEKIPRDILIKKISSTKPLYAQEWLLEKMLTYKGKYATQKPKGS